MASDSVYGKLSLRVAPRSACPLARRMYMLAKSKKIPFVAVTAAICCVAALCEQKPAPSGPAGVREFPVTLRQKVEAGATPVGTKVEAELVVATLVDGVVIPRDAVFTGEVVESAAKSATDP